jgi:hypothetical protein
MRRVTILGIMLSALLLVWLVAGAGTPWCLDDGLRLLAASGPDAARVAQLDAVVNSGPPALPLTLKAPLYPVVEPFVEWTGRGPTLVFPPLYLLLLWLFRQLGEAGPPLLALLSALFLAFAAQRLARVTPGADAAGRRLWWIALLGSPVLFYLGVSWEFALATALLLLLLRERLAPWPLPVSLLHGLLPWLRPELALVWAGGLFLLKGWPRRLLSLAGFGAGLLLHHALTGRWIWLQVSSNYEGAPWRPLANLASFWLPAHQGWALGAGLALLGGLGALQLWKRGRTWAAPLWLAGAAGFAWSQAAGADQMLPCWGALATAPLAVWGLLGLLKQEGRAGLGPELLLLGAQLLFITLASPVNLGFHWGPRLLVPALVPLGLWAVLREPSPGVRRLWLGGALAAQLAGVLLLGLRRDLVARQDEALARLEAPVLLTSETYLVGDHPSLAAGRLVAYPSQGERHIRPLLAHLRQSDVDRLDLVVRPGHPLPVLLVRHLGLEPLAAPQPLPTSRLGAPLEVHQLRLEK